MALAKTPDEFNPEDLLNPEEQDPSQLPYLGEADNPDAPARQPGFTLDPSQINYTTMAGPTQAEMPEAPPSEPSPSTSVSAPTPTNSSPTSPYSEPTINASGQPWGSQPGSQNTGINGGAIASGAQVQPAGGYTIPTGLPVPGGFDATKWSDPNKHDPKYDVGRMVAAGMTNEQISAMLQAQYPGWTVTGKDIITDPQGLTWDFRRDVEGANAPFWEQAGGGSTGMTSGAGAAGSGAVSALSATNPYTSTNPFGNSADSIEAAIMRLLARGESPVDANDPNIAGPTAAFRAQQEMQARRARNTLAERDAAIGLNSGGSGSGQFSSAIQSQLEQAGLNTANFQGKAMLDELQARRQDVVNALQLAQGQEKMSLQYTLAQMDDQIRRLQLSQQNNQFYDQFTYNMGKDNLDRDAMLTRYLLES